MEYEFKHQFGNAIDCQFKWITKYQNKQKIMGSIEFDIEELIDYIQMN